MGANSSISWTTHTFNPWCGCTKVSDGCKNCYAEKLSARNPAVLGVWGDKGTRVVAAESYWKQPLAWDKAAKAAGERHRVFCASLADVFEARPDLEAPRARLYRLIEATPNLDWLLLTKRPENADRLMQRADIDSRVGESLRVGSHPVWPSNVWLGTSVENQAAADERIPILLTIPATVRFLSCEPLLGPISLDCVHWDRMSNIDALRGRHGVNYPLQGSCGKIDWVIAGGESGPNARPMHPDWARSLRDQCQEAGVAFHFKQWGEWVAGNTRSNGTDCNLCLGVVDIDGKWTDGRPFGYGIDFNRSVEIARVGKKDAGRFLDGREWNELPAPRQPEAAP